MMQVSVVLFQIDFDRFSALVVNVNQQNEIWKNTFESRHALITTLQRAKLVNEKETRQLRKDWFSRGGPLLKVSTDHADIEAAGFTRVCVPTSPRM
jgi:hypothetical protein